ncbi:MAG TPA: DegQ family serine endoprotease [Anaeromyxobacteraceae bacterium]|nr:DegQ family serine endoprotease [Anaeromyxobacteraceae bacterium]
MSRTLKRASVALLAAAAMFAAGALSLGRPLRTLAEPPRDPSLAFSNPASGIAAHGSPDFTAIVRQYGPAVVNVSVVQSPKHDDTPQMGDNDDDSLPRFGLPFGFPPPHGDEVHRGIGSGFIVRSDGLILTNAHVVANASEVTVKLTDKREFRAKVLGSDKDTDIAVLRINASDLPTVRLGDASKAQVGEWVLAIGSPFGFENTVTAGVISARARSLPGEGYIPFLQTDVPVNPGNSGGPLFNLAGEVIGINSQIYSESGGYQGISFAIPINVAMKVGEELASSGRVTRGRIGVGIQDVNAQLAKSFGLTKPIGALVTSIDKEGPAAKSDLKTGDVILALNGEEVTNSTDLPPRVADIRPGETAKLTVWRDGKEHEVDVKVGAAQRREAVATNQGSGHGRLGLAVRPLTPDEQRQADVQSGVMVEGVSGPAGRAGLKPGDVVLSVNGTPVKSVDQLRDLVKGAKDEVALLVQRGDSRIFVPVELG